MGLIQLAVRVHFGEGELEKALGKELGRNKVSKPLIVTDKGVAAVGLLDRLKAAIPGGDGVVFDETPENPTEAASEQAAALYKAEGCDGVIALGGGSPLDLAKGVLLLASQDGKLSDFVAAEGGATRIKPGVPPMIAVPTTAGTGSEVSYGAVIILKDGRKEVIASQFLAPRAAICDPTLTYGLPPRLTAGTGMDAVTHSIEAICAPVVNPVADGIGYEGLRLAGLYLKRAVDDGSDAEARKGMLASATNGALAFTKGLGAVHAASHALGGLEGKKLHHGTLNAVLLPHVLRFNAPKVAHLYPVIAAAMGFAKHADLPEAIRDFTASLGLPTTLGEMGVDETVVQYVAERAVHDVTTLTNPRKPEVADYAEIVRAAL